MCRSACCYSVAVAAQALSGGWRSQATAIRPTSIPSVISSLSTHNMNSVIHTPLITTFASSICVFEHISMTGVTFNCYPICSNGWLAEHATRKQHIHLPLRALYRSSDINTHCLWYHSPQIPHLTHLSLFVFTHIKQLGQFTSSSSASLSGCSFCSVLAVCTAWGSSTLS